MQVGELIKTLESYEEDIPVVLVVDDPDSEVADGDVLEVKAGGVNFMYGKVHITGQLSE